MFFHLWMPRGERRIRTSHKLPTMDGLFCCLHVKTSQCTVLQYTRKIKLWKHPDINPRLRLWLYTRFTCCLRLIPFNPNNQNRTRQKSQEFLFLVKIPVGSKTLSPLTKTVLILLGYQRTNSIPNWNLMLFLFHSRRQTYLLTAGLLWFY